MSRVRDPRSQSLSYSPAGFGRVDGAQEESSKLLPSFLVIQVEEHRSESLDIWTSGSAAHALGLGAQYNVLPEAERGQLPAQRCL